MTKLVYLAHPIDQVKQPGNQPERMARVTFTDRFVDHLSRILLDGLDTYTYDPASAFRMGVNPDTIAGAEEIAGINRVALNRSSAVVAVLPAGVATIGTIVEIERAIADGKPTWLVVDDDLYKKSVQVRDWGTQPNVWVSQLEFTDDDPFAAIQHLEPVLRAVLDAEYRPEPITQQLPVKYLDEDAREPKRSYGDDAGFDLYCTSPCTVGAGEFKDIPTGVAVAIPTGCWGLIIGRSSTWRTRKLNVILGVIDAGYRGMLFAAVHNPNETPVNIQRGDRLAQLVILPAWSGSLLRVDELPDHPRGQNGFGSSGR